MGLSEDRKIDLANLHLEWQRMPELVDKWFTELATAKEALGIAEQKRDLMENELFLDVKKNPKDFGYDKAPTDSIAKSEAKIDEEYQSLVLEAIKAKKEVDMINRAIKAISYKKTALGDEVSLWLGKYFSEPRASKGASGKEVKEEIEGRQEKSFKDAVRKKINRKKKQTK